MNKSKGLLFGLSLIVSTMTFVNVSYAESSSYITLDAAVNKALENNSGLKVRRAHYDASLQMPAQVSALPEPRLMLNAVNLPLNSFSFSQTPMTQLQLGISQNLPYPGKLALKEKIAIDESLVNKEAIELTSQMLVQQVKYSWWQLFYIDRSLDTVENNLELLLEFIDVAETKYTVGQGLQQEVLLAHVEFAKLEDNQIQIKAMRLKVEANLNDLLNQDTQTSIAINKEVSTDLPLLKTLVQMLKEGEDNRPEIRQAKLKIAAAKSRVSLAEKDYYPDFKVGAVYGWRQDRTDLASIQFSMNLPINAEKRQDRKKDQRNYEWIKQKYMLEDLKSTVAKEIHRAMADYERSRKRTAIYQDQIIPQATQTIDSMLAGYQVNKVDFLNLLRSQVNLFNFQTQYWRALSSANQALAALEYAVGSEVINER